MKSSPLRQSLADSASALRCAAANLSAAKGSSRWRGCAPGGPAAVAAVAGQRSDHYGVDVLGRDATKFIRRDAGRPFAIEHGLVAARDSISAALAGGHPTKPHPTPAA